MDHSHRRLNLLTDQYVLVSPHRTQRPWQGRVDDVSQGRRPEYDPGCYLCPGNARAGHARNPDYPDTFVFDNDFPALQPDEGGDISDGDGLLVATPETGRCRVVCFSPRHDLTLAELDTDALVDVVRTWRHEYEMLGADPQIAYVQIFENKGEIMGCSNPHPHGQIWAQSSVPNEPATELRCMHRFFERHGRPLLIDYLDRELELGERIVAGNDSFVALVPFWATWPFESMILPRRQLASLDEFGDQETVDFAAILGALTAAYDRVFDVSFPYSAGIHQVPTDGGDYAHCTMHMHFYPPLLRSASVRKFMVGYELLAEAQRDITPEISAERLRECVRQSA